MGEELDFYPTARLTTNGNIKKYYRIVTVEQGSSVTVTSGRHDNLRSRRLKRPGACGMQQFIGRVIQAARNKTAKVSVEKTVKFGNLPQVTSINTKSSFVTLILIF